MTLLSVVKDVCATVGVLQPTSVFTNIANNRTMQEMLACANEMAQRIAFDGRDWTLFRKTATFTGDGTTTAFDLPGDYRRMLLTSNVWRSTSTQQPMQFISDTDQWLNRRMGGRNFWEEGIWGEWTLLGGQMHIFPVLAVGETAYFAYLERNCVVLNSGGFGDNFVSDNDSFALDERVLKLGMIWDWKAKKGSPYSEDLGTYQDALEYLSGHDGPSPILIPRRTISTWGRGFGNAYI